MAWGKKKEQMPSLEELSWVRGNEDGEVKGVRKLTDKQMKQAARLARGEVSRVGDLKAGLSDFKKGKTFNGSNPPKPRKGRSMWS